MVASRRLCLESIPRTFRVRMAFAAAFCLLVPAIRVPYPAVHSSVSAPRVSFPIGMAAGSADTKAVPGTEPTSGSSSKPAATIAGLARWDPQAWVVPAVWNTGAFRGGSLAAVLVIAAAGSRGLGARAATFAHLIAFGSLFGSMIYTTFFAGITMYKNLPRQTFGRLQSKLFPIYFKLHAASLCVMLGTMGAVGGAGSLTRPLVACGSALVFTLINVLYLEPQSTKVMFERYSLENEGKQESDEYKAAAKKFGPLHGMSSLANLGALLGVVAHSWWLGGAFMA